MSKNASPLYAVVGATGGIGSEICRHLAAEGARLVVGSRNEEDLDRMERTLGATGVVVDAGSFEAVDAFFEQVDRIDEHLSGVVNCAGSLLLKPAHQTTQEELESTLAANITTAFAVVRSAAPRMRKAGGSIVLMSSSAAQIGLPNHEAIGAAKAGVGGLAIAAAATYASSGIRVNAIAPGLVKTPLTSRIVENEMALKASTALHPLGRIGEPQDVASLVVWLLGPESSWVTGQVWAIDGGLSGLKGRVAG